MSILNIKLFEHNSSRLLFIEESVINNINNFELFIKDTTDSEYCTEMDDTQYVNNWLLGRLDRHTWLLEDVGIYDSNHEHTADIYYIDNNGEEQILYHIIRIYEYSGECDRLYVEHGGSTGFILLNSGGINLNVNFYIKYERDLPSVKEYVGTGMKSTTGERIDNCVMFFKYNALNKLILYQSIRINFNLETIEDLGEINYSDITPKDINIDFAQLSIKYDITNNTQNNPKYGAIGILSLDNILPEYMYYGKFVSENYYINNDKYVQPTYYIIQSPQNRSWICYRSCYSSNGYYSYTYGVREMYDEYLCCYINRENCGLTGMNGIYDNNNSQYIYEINIDKSKNYYCFMLPEGYLDYDSITFLNENNNEMTLNDNYIDDVYNELDGIIYKVFNIRKSSSINKIIIRYNV